jgi:hypothetical protein
MREIARRENWGTGTSSASPTTYRINSVLASPLSAPMPLLVTRLPGVSPTGLFLTLDPLHHRFMKLTASDVIQQAGFRLTYALKVWNPELCVPPPLVIYK